MQHMQLHPGRNTQSQITVRVENLQSMNGSFDRIRLRLSLFEGAAGSQNKGTAGVKLSWAGPSLDRKPGGVLPMAYPPMPQDGDGTFGPLTVNCLEGETVKSGPDSQVLHPIIRHTHSTHLFNLHAFLQANI